MDWLKNTNHQRWYLFKFADIKIATKK